MTSLGCRQTRRRLAAYRDRELPMEQQLAVRAHLADCPSCLAESEVDRRLGATLRHASAGRVEALGETLASLHARVVARVQADPPQPLRRRAVRAIDDGHWLWAVAGATAATLLCLLAVMGVARLSQQETPRSMAALIGAMADPGSNRNPMSIGDRLLMPRAYPGEMMAPGLPDRDMVFALSAVVTREGHVRNVELLMPGTLKPWEAEQVLEVLDLAAQTRFEPARSGGGTPVAVNVVWLMERTTVIGKDQELRVAPTWRPLRETAPTTPRMRVPMSSVSPGVERVSV